MFKNELSSFLEEYVKQDSLRLFMPGHQGRCSFLNKNISPIYDITEIKGADYLYNSLGVIKNLEDKISKLYFSDAYISASGSTLCIFTILWLLRKRKFIANRSAHISFYNAAALFSISPIFIGNTRTVSLAEIKKAILKAGFGSVLFITSPNYYGEVLDIAKIAKMCDKYNVILVVDGAHGSHLRFTKENLHPISLGAKFCIDSFHKTLPALTGASVLHVNCNMFNRDIIKKSMAIFGSSSPSYLIMHSIGLCVDWLEEKAYKGFLKLQQRKEDLINSLNLVFLKTDPSKLVLDCFYVEGGFLKVVEILEEEKIEAEFYNKNFVCFILTPFLKSKDFKRLKKALRRLNFAENKEKVFFNSFKFKRILSLNEAIFAEKEEVVLKEAIFKVAAEVIWSDVPGVPILTYGEMIDFFAIKILKEKKIKSVVVVKDLKVKRGD